MKHLNKTLISALTAALVPLAASASHSGQADGNYDFAKVVQVEPIVQVVQVETPRNQCWTENVVQRNYRGNRESYTPLLLGGILGGVLGNQFGAGDGQILMTVGGALLGASVGNDVGNRRHFQNNSYVTTQQVCQTVVDYHSEEQLDGYKVTYRYKGQHYVTKMDHKPGRRIKIRVDLTPLDDDGYYGSGYDGDDSYQQHNGYNGSKNSPQRRNHKTSY